MEGVVINVMSKAKKPSKSKNLGWHNSQKGKETGNRDDDYKKYNFDVLEMNGEKSELQYNKYFNNHVHKGYHAHLEELKEGDFVLPRDNENISKIESIIVSPNIKIYLKDIDKFNFDESKSFFNDYIYKYIKKDPVFKNIKILSAKVHCNEVYYPRFEEIEKDGETILRKLSPEESLERAYIKVHMHMDFIPLVECEKDGVKYLKCSSKELWKSQKGRYFDSYREYNDRFYNAIGKEYGVDRGQVWEEWDERVQKKRNGESVKEKKELSEWQIERDEEMHKQYIKQLEKEKENYVSKTEESKQVMEEMVSQASLNHIGLLVVDEIQNVCNHKSGIDLVGMLTQLINNSGISICMVGTPNCIQFFESEMQLARRSLGLRYGTVPFDDYFRDFCKTVFSYQYVKNQSVLTDSVVEWLYEHSAGVISIVISLIYDAQEVAILNGTETINLETLREAYESRFGMMDRFIQPTIIKNGDTTRTRIKKNKKMVQLPETTVNLNNENFSYYDIAMNIKKNGLDAVQTFSKYISITEVAL